MFCGIGGYALGFQNARAEYRGMVGQIRTLVGIDCDPESCQDFEYITGAPAAQMDLFTREQYISFHGKKPPEGWREVSSDDLLRASGLECPDIVALSPPCKGFSGLLPSEKSKSDKYQALNQLVIRGLQLVIDAYQENLPAVIMIENVPRITSRGESLLRQVKNLLGSQGYVFHEGFHDCGELGGLAQHRKRYLLIARLESKMSSFIYRPHKKRVKSIGEVIGPLPMPDDPAMGAMHRLSRLQWKTWVRLALIPAGGDWRDLENCGQYQIEHIKRGSGSFGVQEWDNPAHTVVGNTGIGGSTASAISDPRLNLDKESTHRSIYRVTPWEETSNTITGAHGPNNGAIVVADPRIDSKSPKFNHVYKLSKWDEPAGVITGGVGPSNGAITVSDPRVTGGYSNKRQVLDWDGTATTVTGTPDIQSGAQSISDPRFSIELYPSSYGVNDWNNPSPTIRSAGRVMNAPVSIADPRLGCKCRNGSYGVQDWDKPSTTVIGAGDIHSGTTAIADPRIPGDTEVLDPAPVIIALDGTWHRPLTTLELAVLQSLKPIMTDGRPLILAGHSDARWRERIGNMVPPDAAEAIGEEILLSFMASEFNDEWTLSCKDIWVKGSDEERVSINARLH